MDIKCRNMDIIYAQKRVVSLPGGLKLLACTLWSDINGYECAVRQHMQDFTSIYDMNIEKWKNTYTDHLNWLTGKINEYNGNVIVATHHAPLIKGTSSRIFENTPTNHGYSTDLGNLVSKTKGWIFGHTHYVTNMQYFPKDSTDPIPVNPIPVNPIPVVSNPVGYRQENTCYKKDAIFYISRLQNR